jgi:hypothetical protein
LQNRKISPQSTLVYQLGFAPRYSYLGQIFTQANSNSNSNSNSSASVAPSIVCDKEELIAAGLCIKNNNNYWNNKSEARADSSNDIYDRFRSENIKAVADRSAVSLIVIDSMDV